MSEGGERVSQAHTLHDDAALDAVSALGVLRLTLIGTFILEADTGDLQSRLGCGPLRGQGAIHFAPLDSGDGAGRGDRTRGELVRLPSVDSSLNPHSQALLLSRQAGGGGEEGTQPGPGKEQ